MPIAVSFPFERTGRPVGLCATILLMLLSSNAHAIDLDPGDYVPAAPGTSAVLLYYQHAQRNALYASGQRQPLRPGLASHIGIARLVHWMDVRGVTFGPQILLPFGRLEGRRDTEGLGRTSGVGDIILAAPAWLVNQPEQRNFWGVTPYLYLPTGSYRADRSLNLGENRWKLNLQTGMVKGWTSRWWTDLTGDVMFHGKNDAYGSIRATLRQKPLVQLQGYLRYQVRPGANVYVGLSRTWGGASRVNGVRNDDEAHQLKMSVGGSYFIGSKTQIMAALGRDLKVRSGFKESLRMNLRLLQLF